MTPVVETETIEKSAAEVRDERRRRSEELAARVGEIDARLPAIDVEEAAVRLAYARGELDFDAYDGAVTDLESERKLLLEERPRLERDAAAVAVVLAEAEAEAADEAIEEARAAGQPLLDAEQKAWRRVGLQLRRLEQLYDQLIENARDLEQLRRSLPADVAAEFRSVQPWPVDFRSFCVFVAELSTNDMKRSYHGVVGDPRVDLLPDLRTRFTEANVFDGVETWRWRP